MTPTLQRKKLRVRESLVNLLEISPWQVAETGFKCKSKTVEILESVIYVCQSRTMTTAY